MGFIINIYNTFCYEPLFNLLIWLYNVVPGNDIGLAIIILTLIIRLVLLPLYWKSIKSQRALQDLQPKIEKLKKQYKNDKEKMSAELMNLYKAEKVNPFSSCLPIIIQFPFLIAVYQVFRHGLESESLDILYSFVANPGVIDSISFGFIDLGVPSVVLAFLAGAAQFWQAKMMVTRKPGLTSKGKQIPGSGDEKMMAMMNKQMVYFMPIFTVIIGISLPAGLTLYWFITTLLMALQQVWMFSRKPGEDNTQDDSPKPDDNQPRKIVEIEEKQLKK